jgi:regulator of sirC expression with transglutaminase-like and TPR domain
MNTKELLKSFSEISAQDSAEFEIALLVCALIDEDADLKSVRRSFDEFTGTIVDEEINSIYKLLDFFKSQGFGQVINSSVDLSHSSVDWVLRQRHGIPIVLSILLIHTARQCGLDACGINFPGHFLARIDNCLVDPMTMNVVEAGQLNVADAPGMMIQATTRMIGLRMLNNIKAMYIQVKDWQKVLQIVEYQFAIDDGNAEVMASLHFERGECWQKLGSLEAAHYEFTTCAAICPYPELTKLAEQCALALEVSNEVLH